VKVLPPFESRSMFNMTGVHWILVLLFSPIIPIGSTLHSIVTLNTFIEVSSLITWNPINFSRFKRWEVGAGEYQCTRPHPFMHSSPQLSKVGSHHTMATQPTILLIYGDLHTSESFALIVHKFEALSNHRPQKLPSTSHSQ
jgi:hypothetical protein